MLVIMRPIKCALLSLVSVISLSTHANVLISSSMSTSTSTWKDIHILQRICEQNETKNWLLAIKFFQPWALKLGKSNIHHPANYWVKKYYGTLAYTPHKKGKNEMKLVDQKNGRGGYKTENKNSKKEMKNVYKKQ